MLGFMLWLWRAASKFITITEEIKPLFLCILLWMILLQPIFLLWSKLSMKPIHLFSWKLSWSIFCFCLFGQPKMKWSYFEMLLRRREVFISVTRYIKLYIAYMHFTFACRILFEEFWTLKCVILFRELDTFLHVFVSFWWHSFSKVFLTGEKMFLFSSFRYKSHTLQ